MVPLRRWLVLLGATTVIGLAATPAGAYTVSNYIDLRYFPSGTFRSCCASPAVGGGYINNAMYPYWDYNRTQYDSQAPTRILARKPNETYIRRDSGYVRGLVSEFSTIQSYLTAYRYCQNWHLTLQINARCFVSY